MVLFKVFPPSVERLIRNAVSEAIAERKKNKIVRNDLIDTFIGLRKEAIEGDDGSFANDDDILFAQAAVFYSAGFETASTEIAFALFEIAKNVRIC